MKLSTSTELRIFDEACEYQKARGGFIQDYKAGAIREAKLAAATIAKLQEQLQAANTRAQEIAAYLRSDKFATTGNDYVHVSTDMIHKIEELITLTNQ